jgi:hypothetical protein
VAVGGLEDACDGTRKLAHPNSRTVTTSI